MQNLIFGCFLAICFFSCSESGKQSSTTKPETKITSASLGESQKTIFKAKRINDLRDLNEEGLAQSILDENLSKERLDEIAEVIYQSQLSAEKIKESNLLLFRMSKEDFRKTWLASQQKKITWYSKESDIPDIIKRKRISAYVDELRFYDLLFKQANQYEKPYLRLSEKIQNELQSKVVSILKDQN